MPASESALRRYVLGRLPAADTLHLERDLAGDASLRDRLDLVTDELIESYALGDLDARSRRCLETGYLCTPDGAMRLALVRFLERAACRAGVRPRRRN